MCDWVTTFIVMSVQKQKRTEEQQSGVAFNGSLQTLDRIHDILVHMQRYAANGHVIGWKANMKELFKEVQGFLTKAERKTAWNKWGACENFPIVITEEGARYDVKLEAALDDFDFWIRRKLADHNITMSSKKEWQHGLAKLAKKYDLEYDDYGG